tara:strand:- start:299 stop:463 length:165 start_codon:yes stop_codon:yes gene_type:complete
MVSSYEVVSQTANAVDVDEVEAVEGLVVCHMLSLLKGTPPGITIRIVVLAATEM